MDDAGLNGTYHRLRAELDRAYGAPEWRAEEIDRIADELAEVERAMVRHTPLPNHD